MMVVFCRTRLFVFGIAFLFGVSAVAASSSVVKLALNWKPEPQFGGFYTAELIKADRKNGVQLQIQPGGAGTPVVQMVAAGQADFGIASADEVILSRANGSDVVALFAVYQTNPQAIMAHASRGFGSLVDLFQANGTVAVQKGLPYVVYLQRKYGRELKAKLVPYVGGVSNFLADNKHSQQCFVTSEPLLARAKGAAVTTFLVSESGYNPYTTVLISRSSLVRTNLKLVQAMVATVREGWRSYLTDAAMAETTNQRMHALNPALDLETLRASARTQKPLILPKNEAELGKMTLQRWEELQNQLIEIKVLSRRMPPAELFRNE